MFVKDHFAVVKKENPGCAHKDVMAILSKRYREQKNRVTWRNDISPNEDSGMILIEGSEAQVERMMTSLAVLDLH
jgi:hypothetical protein